MPLSHLDEHGNARMVDVGHKPDTERMAVAAGEVRMRPETLALIRAGQIKKGDVLTVAQLAGVMAAKRTSELIPLCHPLPLTHIDVRLELRDDLPGVGITRHGAHHGQDRRRDGGADGCERRRSDGLRHGQGGREDYAHYATCGLLEKHGGASGDIVNE